MAWTFHVDGSFNDSDYSAGLVFGFIVLECLKIEYVLRLKFKASNNKAEYEAFFAGLRLTQVVRAKHLNIFNYSQLIV